MNLRQFEALLVELQRHTSQSESVRHAIERAQCVYLLAPSSLLGVSYGRPILEKLVSAGKQVVLVDDVISINSSPFPATTIIGTSAPPPKLPLQCLAINMAFQPFTWHFFSSIAANAGIPMIDILEAIDWQGGNAVYQSVDEIRDATLRHLDDYDQLAQKLSDPLSVQTLGAILAMRVKMDRRHLLPILCSYEDLYFSPYPAGKNVTFTLSDKEIFCDVGAYNGDTIRKFLAATHWKYLEMHAFEPDSKNFGELDKGFFKNLPCFYPHNVGLSDTQSISRFWEIGTMGSRISPDGNAQIRTTRLDDEMPHVSFIKMDAEGSEPKIIAGARHLIARCRPRLALSCYHYAEDLLSVPKAIREIDPEYKLRLRHHCFYYFDSILYASR